MRMAELDIAMLLRIETIACEVDNWAFDRRMRRQDSMYGPGSALRMTVTRNQLLDIEFGGEPGHSVDLPKVRSLSVEVAADDQKDDAASWVVFGGPPPPVVQKYGYDGDPEI
jgi:hypothetical protein